MRFFCYPVCGSAEAVTESSLAHLGGGWEVERLLRVYYQEMPLTLPIITPRLKLRLHQSGDLEDLLAYHSQPKVARYLLKEPWTRRGRHAA